MTYYDSQSGQWVPSLPDGFTVALDATANSCLDDTQGLQSGIAEKESTLHEISSNFSSVLLPSTPIMMNNNNLLSFSSLFPKLRMIVPSTFPYNASMEFPQNVVFAVPWSVSSSGVLDATLGHVKGHTSKSNSVMAVLSGWEEEEGFMTASSVGKLLDLDVALLNLSIDASTDPSKLLETVEEIGYLDAPGVPAKGRMVFSSKDWSKIDDECWEIIEESVPGGDIIASAVDAALIEEKLIT